MKKMLTKIAAVLCAAVMLTACAGQGSGSAPSSGSDKLTIVTTIFPEYDWVMQILGDKAADADVTMLLDNGVELHSYQPVASDILKISEHIRKLKADKLNTLFIDLSKYIFC